jgi:hypothetical protein
MMNLTTEMFEAMAAHRAEYIASNPNRCKTPKRAERAWREQLIMAWLNDWREQWGLLRSVRNDVGIMEALEQFNAMRPTQKS